MNSKRLVRTTAPSSASPQTVNPETDSAPLVVKQKRTSARALPGLHDGHRVQYAITILKPVHEVFEFCRHPENFQRFMKQLADIQVVSDGSSLWTWNSISGAPIQFEAEIIALVEDRMISWETHDTSKLQHAGSLWFQAVRQTAHGAAQSNSLGEMTELQLQLVYRWTTDSVVQDFEELFADDPASLIQEDLRRLKQLLEAGEIATTEGQTHGARSLLH